ncbi:MAG: hypothetical protein WB992_20000 [Bryobacteraceae bacterium]
MDEVAVSRLPHFQVLSGGPTGDHPSVPLPESIATDLTADGYRDHLEIDRVDNDKRL